MSMAAAFLNLNADWDEVLPWLDRKLREAGFRIKTTFDLQAARQPQSQCECPYHLTARCNCQMLVWLLYRDQQAPITLMIHGYDASTFVSMVESPAQRADPRSETLIRRLLVLPSSPDSSSEQSTKAGA